MVARKRKEDGGTHQFGGQWTDLKLKVLASYLKSYTTALKDKPSAKNPFHKAYIDAFAGTGYRILRQNDGSSSDNQCLLFPDLAENEPQNFLNGSARIALQAEPRFDKYVFIEQSLERCAQLKTLQSDFPNLAQDIDIRQGEANEQIRSLCEKDWKSHRAVMFLDPYGMQVEWLTIEKIAKTEAIDLWLLFPLGIGVNRLLMKSGDIPEPWRRRLDLLLGSTGWYEEFYRIEKTRTLFGDEQEFLIKASMETIGHYFNNRLREIFAGVVNEPGVLRNSKNNPLYLLCFAVANKRGSQTALRIANHLLKELQ